MERVKETTNWTGCRYCGIWRTNSRYHNKRDCTTGRRLEHRIILCYDTVLDRPTDSAVLSGMGDCPGSGIRARSGEINRRCQHRTGTEKQQGRLVRELEGIALTYLVRSFKADLVLFVPVGAIPRTMNLLQTTATTTTTTRMESVRGPTGHVVSNMLNMATVGDGGALISLVCTGTCPRTHYTPNSSVSTAIEWL